MSETNKMPFQKKKWGWQSGSKKQKTEKQKLIKKLDRIFSKYIRMRDADENGICKCITCQRHRHWKEMDAGHFISREKPATKYHEKNVNAQCKECNRFKAGNQYSHGIAIDKKFGNGTAEHLYTIGNARGSKIDKEWLKLKIDEFEKKLWRFDIFGC